MAALLSVTLWPSHAARSDMVPVTGNQFSASASALPTEDSSAGSTASTPLPGTVPRAGCGPDDHPETGLQGQVPQVDRLSGRSQEGYRCNLELVGQYAGEGASWQHASTGDCAYYSTANNARQSRPGTAVIDASDPTTPRETTSLTSKAFLQPWESLKLNEARGLLAGVEHQGDRIAIYDVSTDCREPGLLGERVIPQQLVGPRLRGHAGDFAPDGMTYYASQDASGLPAVGWWAIDTSDPKAPKELFRFDLDKDNTGYAHDLAVSDDGMRLYVAQPHPAVPNAPGHNGLDILDVSDIQLRRPNPEVRHVGSIHWTDGSLAQVPLPVKIDGRQYIIFTDEMGAGGLTGHLSTARACAAGAPPFGFARIIDITDEQHPVIVSKLMLEVHDPANCTSILNDETTWFGYDSHYCSVDNKSNARLLACSYFQSGLRVFDIRNPARPREIAYYNPPARPTTLLPGSSNGIHLRGAGHGLAHVGDRTADWTTSKPTFRRGGAEIWFTSLDNGFQIVRLTNGLWPLHGPAMPVARHHQLNPPKALTWGRPARWVMWSTSQGPS